MALEVSRALIPAGLQGIPKPAGHRASKRDPAKTQLPQPRLSWDDDRHAPHRTPRRHQLSSVRSQVLSGLYSFIFWKIARVFGPRSFWYTIPS